MRKFDHNDVAMLGGLATIICSVLFMILNG